MHAFVARRPLAFAAWVMVALEAIVLAGLLAARLLGVPVIALDLPLLLLNGVCAVGLLSTLGWWQASGFNKPSEWRNLHLLLPMVLLLSVPLLVQPQLPDAGKIVALAVVTLLIGFQEEAIFRGLLLRALAPGGVLQAVLISAALFGGIHANSLLVGRDPLFVLAQIIASVLAGIGIGALRVRTNTIWPLIVLHALNDFVQFTATGGIEAHHVALYIPLVKVGISALVALYGLYLLRREIAQQTLRPVPNEAGSL
jgi:hypothetical protein